MTRRIWLTAAAIALLAAPAFAAEEKCSAPIAPVVPAGKTATVQQLSQAAKDVVAFIKDSDQFQACILADIAAQDQAAKDNKKTLDPAIKKALEARGDDNQKEKERIGKAYNTAAAAYKAAHPK